MTERRQIRGFSVFEMLVALTILAMLLTLGLSNSKDRQKDLTTEGLAGRLAETFQSQRLAAMASGSPRALIFSSESGATALSRSALVISGYDQPRFIDNLQLAQDHKNLVIFVGHPQGGGSVPPSVRLSKGSFQPETWLPTSYLQDLSLIFLPDGKVTSRGIPLKEGQFHFIASLGAKTATSSPLSWPSAPNPNTFKLNQAGSARTIKVSPSGSITVTSGATGIDNTIREVITSGVIAGVVEPVYRSQDSPPEFAIPSSSNRALEIEPMPSSQELTSGVTTTLQADDYLSFKTHAKDPDGDELSVRWDVQALPGNKSPGDGDFSASDREMDFDLSELLKGHTISWRPPAEAKAGDKYRLTVELNDGKGQITENTDAQIRDVEVIEPGKIIYLMEGQTQVLGFDGSDRGPYHLSLHSNARFSADGQRYVEVTSHGMPAGTPPIPNGDGPHTGWTARTKYLDGTEEEGDLGGRYGLQIIVAGIAPGGEKIAFLARNRNRPSPSMADPFVLYICDFDGDNLKMALSSGNPVSGGVFFKRANIYTAHNEHTEFGRPLNPGQRTYGKDGGIAWSPDGKIVLFQKTIGGWDKAATGIAAYNTETKTVNWVKKPEHGNDTEFIPGANATWHDIEDNHDFYNVVWGFGNRICFVEEGGGYQSPSVVAEVEVTSAGEVRVVSQRRINEPAHANIAYPSPFDDNEVLVKGWTAANANATHNSIYKFSTQGGLTEILDPTDHVYVMVVTR